MGRYHVVITSFPDYLSVVAWKSLVDDPHPLNILLLFLYRYGYLLPHSHSDTLHPYCIVTYHDLHTIPYGYDLAMTTTLRYHDLRRLHRYFLTFARDAQTSGICLCPYFHNSYILEMIPVFSLCGPSKLCIGRQ